MPTPRSIWCHSALLEKGWADDVLMGMDDDGLIRSVDIGVPSHKIADDVERLSGTLVPGMCNLHSHAHQRAMAGLGERASGKGDSFWTWRNAMYHCLARIEPDHLYDIARMLYLEMLQGGYTRVGEFQYLHHDTKGQAYANRAEMTLQCRQAAWDVGIGFTALPVLYRYGGFGKQPVADAQKRFVNDADGFLEIVSSLRQGMEARDRVGIAPHSLRAISEPLLREVLEQYPPGDKVHIHIAEQVKEIEDCVSWSGQTPVAWLYQRFAPAHDWCLIHATHMDQAECTLLADSGAIVGLCPTTEANLGDGFFSAATYFAANGAWGIGSDSQISVNVVEELRWLEYGQRLKAQGRNILAGESEAQWSTGQNLLIHAARGGAAACDHNAGVLAVGYQADFLLLDDDHPRLYGRARDRLLDSWIFSGNDNLISAVYIAGKPVIHRDGHIDQQDIQEKFRQTIDQLAV